MSEMDEGEPDSKEDKIEEVIKPNHHGHNLKVNLQLPFANDSNYHTNRESEHWHKTSENTNDNNFSGEHGQGNKRAAHLMGSNILDDSAPQSKVPRLNVPSLTTFSNNDRAHPIGASVCTIGQLQEHKDWPNFSTVTAEHETNEKSISPMVSKDTELTVTSDVDILNQNYDQQLSFVLEDSRINKDKELISVVRYGTNDELKNLLELCQNKISFQLSQEALDYSVIQAVRSGENVKVQQLVYARTCSIWSSYSKDVSVAIQDMKLDALLIVLNVGQMDCAKLLMNRGDHLDLPKTKLTVEFKESPAFQFMASQYKTDVNKYNLLHLAVKKSMEDIVSTMIDLGADVNKRNDDAESPLEVALRSQAGESIIKCLIQNGACVNGSGDFVPLHWSIRYSVEITNLLLDSGADVNAREIFDNDTALIAACDVIGLDMEIVKILLARGAQLNLQNQMGWTALHKAICQANIDLIQLLVESGANLEIQTQDNRTAYLLAASEGYIDVIEVLQNLGANTSAVDSRGYNALMLAIQFAQIRTIKTSSFLYLASNGADINHQCNNGYTALMLAAKAREWELLKSLPDLGADVNITASVGPGHNVTALSILLENFKDVSEENSFLDCMDVLIRHGAVNSLPEWCNDVLNQLLQETRSDFFNYFEDNDSDYFFDDSSVSRDSDSGSSFS